MSRAALSFGAQGSVAAAAAAVALALTVVATGLPGGWAATGWLLASGVGLVGGICLASRHGKPGSGFLVALGVTMGARMMSMATGLVLAMRSGGGAAAGAFLAGFGWSFAALTAVEWVWFSRAARASVPRTS